LRFFSLNSPKNGILGGVYPENPETFSGRGTGFSIVSGRGSGRGKSEKIFRERGTGSNSTFFVIYVVGRNFF